MRSALARGQKLSIQLSNLFQGQAPTHWPLEWEMQQNIKWVLVQAQIVFGKIKKFQDPEHTHRRTLRLLVQNSRWKVNMQLVRTLSWILMELTRKYPRIQLTSLFLVQEHTPRKLGKFLQVYQQDLELKPDQVQDLERQASSQALMHMIEMLKQPLWEETQLLDSALPEIDQLLKGMSIFQDLEPIKTRTQSLWRQERL